MKWAHQATSLNLRDFTSPPMRAFHSAWGAFFLCFFAWFGLAPLMPMIRSEMHLAPWQIGNLMFASVAATIIARLLIGRFCDRYGPRLVYSALLCLGSLPVMAVGLARSYESLLFFRFAISIIGASFVVTQLHTSIMFAPNCVGTANATAAGWGNLGGGVTQIVMPLLVMGIMAIGISSFWAWRVAMLLVGIACFIAGIAYYRFTQDAPDGNFVDLRKRGELPPARKHAAIQPVVADPRVWGLFLCYGACFGVELTMDNMAATYFFDRFGLGHAGAGAVAALFGGMNLFARAVGGWVGDWFGARSGLRGRLGWLAAVLLAESLGLVLFANAGSLPAAIAAMLTLGLAVKMSNGATFAVTPFLHRGSLGTVAGIVGAGGNVGAMLASLLFRVPSEAWPRSLMWLGGLALIAALAAGWLAGREAPTTILANEPSLAEAGTSG